MLTKVFPLVLNTVSTGQSTPAGGIVLPPWLNLGNIITSLIVLLVGSGLVWLIKLLVNLGPTATNNARLKDLLDTQERTLKDAVDKNTALTEQMDTYTTERKRTQEAITRLTLQNDTQQRLIDAQQERMDMIELLYEQATGKQLPPMKKVS